MKDEANCLTRCFTKNEKDDELEATQETSFGWTVEFSMCLCASVQQRQWLKPSRASGWRSPRAHPSHSPSLSFPCLRGIRGWFFEKLWSHKQ